MAPRSFWKGYLKLSLVTCPVAMVPAVSDRERVRFHTLNRETGNRVQSVYVDAVTGRRVRPEDEARGYPAGEGRLVIVEDEEIAAVALESTTTIDIETFVPESSIGWIWYDTPHYLVPDDPVGDEAFAVIRAAMAATGTVGIARLVLYRRERAVMLQPRDRGIVLWTLRFGDEVRDAADYFAGLDEVEVEPAMVRLVSELIRQRSKPWDRTMVHDPVQENLLDLIAARRRQQQRAPRRKPGRDKDKGTVVDIVDALKRSLAGDRARQGS